MTDLRILSWLAPALALACVISKPVGDADTETTTTASSSDPSNTDPGSSSADESTGEPDGDPDPRYVDCAAQDWGPTVGGGELGPLDFPVTSCNPRTSGSGFGYRCCSTDPATADGRLPSYQGHEVADGSPPLYADLANDAGTWGQCVRTTDIPVGSGLSAPGADNCPIPCDPTWNDGDVAEVCGGGRVCCQTTALGAKDCVQEDGVWRAVHGDDIGSASVTPATNWNDASHDTHQDPNGTVCLAFAGGDVGSDAFRECIGSLSVADRRGFCMSLGGGQVCPGAAASYVDACEAKNG
jgi:hypothetical protein